VYCYVSIDPLDKIDPSGLWEKYQDEEFLRPETQHKTVVLVSANTTDSDLPSWTGELSRGLDLYTQVSSLRDIEHIIGRYRDGFIKYLVLSGHGLFMTSENRWLSGLTFSKKDLSNNFSPGALTRKTANLIRHKVDSHGCVILASCCAGVEIDDTRNLARLIGRDVVAYTSYTDDGANGDGKGVWRLFKADGRTIYKTKKEYINVLGVMKRDEWYLDKNADNSYKFYRKLQQRTWTTSRPCG
jgi:hypothetical protein